MTSRWGVPAMQRDMDLARQILLEIARRVDSGGSQDEEIVIEGYSRRKVSVHIMLLAKGGLIDAEDLTSRGQLDWIPIKPTNEGYEFLDLSSDEEAWAKAKGMICGMGGAFSFDILRQYLSKLAASMVL